MIAPGTIVVESSVKKVQHPTGGVVGEILVREGAEVEAGQIVLRLDDTVTRATLGVVRSQLDELMAREARLLAEREDADVIVFPKQLTSGREEASATTAVSGEQKLFESRRSARTGQRSQLRERVAQTNEEIRGLSAQQAAKEAELELIKKELTGVTELYQKSLVSISRITQLQRDQTRTQGERGQLIADIARARGKISETELQIIQVDQDFRTEVLKDLRESQGKIAELKERVTAAEDQLKRVDLRSPQTGFVHQLSVHTVGGVINNGEVIMQIVPRADELVVEAKVAPNDIDQIATGATAIVKVMAGNQRTTPEIIGVITRVSADLAHDPQQQNSAQPAPGLLHRPHHAAGGGGGPSQGHPPRSRHAGRGLHPDPRAHPAAVPAQAAARPGRPHLPRALIHPSSFRGALGGASPESYNHSSTLFAIPGSLAAARAPE